MKRYLAAFGAGFCACLMTSGMAHAQDNILKNGGAEEGSEKSVPGWNFSNAALPADQATYGASDVASAGKQGFFISATKQVPLNMWLVQETKLPANAKSVQLSCKAKSQRDAARTQYAGASVGCYFLDANNQWINWQPILTVPESAEWTALAGNVAVPAGATRIGVRLNLMSSGIVSAWFDEVQVTASETYLNTTVNGDFEAAGTAPQGWTLVRKTGTDKSIASGVSTDATQGKQSLRLASTDANAPMDAYWSQAIGVTPGITRYKFSLKGKLKAGAGPKQADGVIMYAFLDKNRREIGALPAGILTGESWAEVASTITAPPDAAYIEMRLGLSGTGATEAFFDSVSLVPVP